MDVTGLIRTWHGQDRVMDESEDQLQEVKGLFIDNNKQKQTGKQDKAGHEMYDDPTYGNEPTPNCKHKEIIKGANEEGNEGEQLGQINQ